MKGCQRLSPMLNGWWCGNLTFPAMASNLLEAMILGAFKSALSRCRPFVTILGIWMQRHVGVLTSQS